MKLHVWQNQKKVEKAVDSIKKKDVRCLIYYDVDSQIVWLVLFDKDRFGAPSVTYVIKVTEKKETFEWVREDLVV